jgi:tRNA-splicing endonuclease subunit Sen15, fungi type
VHPDEQIEILHHQKRLQQERGENESEGVLGLGRLEREWVLPSHLREKWTLRRFGEVFDCIAAIPGSEDGEELFREAKAEAGTEEEGVVVEIHGESEGENEWRTKMPKRILLATLDDDSTVVYYIVHDGIVKPRQN